MENQAKYGTFLIDIPFISCYTLTFPPYIFLSRKVSLPPMADNITFQTTVATPPNATVVATDDVGGVHYQRIKIDVGAENSSALLGNANPLPVSDAGGSITVDGSVGVSSLPATSLAGQTAVTLDFDTGAGTQNIPLVGVALPASGGAVAGGTFTNPIRIDPTATTAQPVTDNGGSLTVDGSISVTGAIPAGNNNIGDVDVASIAGGDNTIGRFKLTDGTTVADVFDYTNSNPLAVRLTDTNGDYVAAGGGTQYTEDVAAAADPVGAMQMARRRDTLSATEVSADGDNIALNSTSKGELYVKHVDVVPINDNGGSLTVDGSVSLAAAIPAGTNNIGDVDVLTVPAPLNVTGGGVESGALRVTLANDSTGLVSVDDNGGSLTVDGTVAVTQATASNLNAQVQGPAAQDAAVSGNPLLEGGRASDAIPTAVSADGDVVAAWLDRRGAAKSVLVDDAGDSVMDGTNNAVRTSVVVALPSGTNNIGDVDVLTVPAPLNVTGNGAASTALRVTLANDSTGIVAGAVAHDAAATGNPFQVAGEARSTDRAVVADADVSRIITTLLGKQVYVPYAGPAQTWNYAAASGGLVNTTGVTAKAAAGAGVRNYITSIQVINGHATQGTDLQIRDGAAGTVLWRGWAQAAGGGASVKCDPPLRGSANTLVEIACGTTGAAVYVNLQGFTASE